MDPNAVLGPVDRQLGPFPARGIVEPLERKDIDKVSDEMLTTLPHGDPRVVSGAALAHAPAAVESEVQPEQAERMALSI